MAREALGIVGAAVGFVIGGPTGAYIGFAAGSTVGGLLAGPTKIPAPGLNEAPAQTSRDGVPRPIIYGVQYVHGNIIQKNPEQIVTTTERQGKGGGGTEVETQQRFRTFAIRVCEGPILGISRIWENNILVYDTRSSPAIPAAETAAFAEGITIYAGDEAQLPDPELEAHWGVDETPAYRGTAYIVFVNKDLTDFGGAIPSYAFEVNGSSGAATVSSTPYPIEAVDGLQPSVGLIEGDVYSTPQEGLELTVTPQAGTLAVKMHSHSPDPEGIEVTVNPQDGTLLVLIHEHTYIEGIDLTVTPQDGTLEPRLVSHDYEPEGLELTVTPQDGTLI